MSTPARRKLMKDYRRLKSELEASMWVGPDPNNIMIWDAIIYGPEDTIFEDGIFKLRLEFAETYPDKPPKVKFVTPMFHPNIYSNGDLCLDILQNRWTPAYDVFGILTCIQSLLNDPNPTSPANDHAASLYLNNRSLYIKTVIDIVESTWKKSDK